MSNNTSSSDNNKNHHSDYNYRPSLGAAYLFTILFAFTWLVHVVQSWRRKTVFMIVLLVAVTMEVIGYATRVVTVKYPNPLWPILVSQICVIVAPAFLAAQDYMIIGRLMAYVAPQYGLVGHGWITKLFVGADILAILTQASGGSMLSGRGSLSALQLGKKILLGGLVLQVVTFGIFIVIALVFDTRTRRAPELKAYEEEMRRLRKLWNAFYVSAFLVMIRCIYRTIEFASIKFTLGDSAPQGYAMTHEWVVYIFDAVPILIASLAFALYHPGAFLPAKKGLRMDGTYEAPPQGRRLVCCGPRRSPPSKLTPLSDISPSIV